MSSQKEVSPKLKVTEQEWGLASSVRLVLISDQSNEIKRNCRPLARLKDTDK